MTDEEFYPAAQPHLARTGITLQAMGLDAGQLVASYLAYGAAVGVAILEAENISKYLRHLADQVDRGELSEQPPTPLN